MTITCGFFNSVNNDRRYDAIQISSLFDGLIKDGVYAAIGDALMVKPSSGLVIAVGSGRAWFNRTWTYNDGDFLLTLNPPDVFFPRIDAVILEVDLDESVRANTIKILTGTPASTPVPPELTRTTTKYQYPLAHITVGVGVNEITASNIVNKVGTEECPFVVGIIETIAIDSLLAQWGSEFREWLAGQDTEFNIWFSTLQADLDGEIATNLQNQINAIRADNWVTTERIAPGAITPSKLSENDTLVYLVVLDVTETLKVVDGAKYFTIPSELDGATLIGARASIYSPSTNGAISVQVARGRRNTPSSSPTYNDILTTKITINQGEYDSSDAIQPVVNQMYKDVATKDVIRIDVDGAGTGAKGLDVGLVFRL